MPTHRDDQSPGVARSWPLALAVAAAVAASSPVSGLGRGGASGGDTPLRVMSFNIRYDNPADGEDAWPVRRDRAASVIRFHAPDLVGLQEALRHQIADLEAALPGFAWFGDGRSAERDGEYCAVLFREDRLELIEQGTFWLSETPGEAGSRSWDAALPRIVTWGRLRDRRSGEAFFFFNTHFDHLGEVARRESAALLVRRLAEIAGPDAPVVLTGDFNATPDSEPYRVLTGTGNPRLLDAMAVSRSPHHGPTSTWNGFGEIVPDRRIDFVFVRPTAEVRRHGILADRFDGGRFPSDHLPVLAEVVLGRPSDP